MQIVIPMTGHGSRFIAEGYARLKPFIKIHEIPMISWVTTMFPGNEDKILFICRSGVRSLHAAKIVNKIGYSTFNISDGFEGSSVINEPGWKASGLPYK